MGIEQPKYKLYPDELRRKAVALSEEIGALPTAKRLGIPAWRVRQWRRDGVRFPGMKRIPTAEDKALIKAQLEIRRLKKKT